METKPGAKQTVTVRRMQYQSPLWVAQLTAKGMQTELRKPQVWGSVNSFWWTYTTDGRAIIVLNPRG